MQDDVERIVRGRGQYDAQEVIERIAREAAAFGQMAGVGAMETAGSIIGYLAENPRDLEPFMNGGIMEMPADFFQRHSLTWHASNGEIVSPAFARRAQTIKKLAKDSNHG
jgi:hypothetical protein